jgi:hypothetical protein
MKTPRNRYDLDEPAGAFGDLGRLIPFLAVAIAWQPAILRELGG